MIIAAKSGRAIYVHQLMKLEFILGQMGSQQGFSWFILAYLLEEWYDFRLKRLNYVLSSCTLIFQSLVNCLFEKH